MTKASDMKRLLSILRLAGSENINESDNAFIKALQLMQNNNISIQNFLDDLDTDTLKQHIVAELARRYCLNDSNLGPSARAEFYRKIFVEIATLYSPQEMKKEEIKTNSRKKQYKTQITIISEDSNSLIGEMLAGLFSHSLGWSDLFDDSGFSKNPKTNEAYAKAIEEMAKASKTTKVVRKTKPNPKTTVKKPSVKKTKPVHHKPTTTKSKKAKPATKAHKTTKSKSKSLAIV